MLKIRAIKFTLETLPTIHNEYPRTEKVYTEKSFAEFYSEGEFIFVQDPFAGTNIRVITKEHFEDVYEIPASMIGIHFKTIY